MGHTPAHDTTTNVASFWRSYVHIGVLTYSMGAFAVVVYALATPGGPHRQALVILGCFSLAASVGPFRWLGLRLVSTRWSKVFFTSWAASTFVLVALAAVLDGGVRSPISYFLVLPMLFAGLAYSAGTVTLLGAFGVVTTLVVGVLTPDPSWPTTAFLAVAMVIVGLITAAAALNRDRLMAHLMAAANLDALTGCLSRGRSRSAWSTSRSWPSATGRRSASSWRTWTTSRRSTTPVATIPGTGPCGRWPPCCRRRPGEPMSSGASAVTSSRCCSTRPTRMPRWLVAIRLKDAMQAANGSDLVTASLGVSTWLGSADRPDELLRRADEALYIAKRAGRNRCAQWEPPTSEAQAGPRWLGRRPRRAEAPSGA